MNDAKQKTSSSIGNKQFLLRIYASRKHFSREYAKLYHGKTNAKELYLQILTELERTVSGNDVNLFKNLCNLISYISVIENGATLQSFYDNKDNPFKSTNLVILACKYNKVEILRLVFSSSNILKNLSIDIGDNRILPNCEDGTCHNAFYYALRSNNIELLDMLIDKWPDDYFAIHSDELDAVLSIAYEELMFKNVDLSDRMEIFVANKLLNLRFFSDGTEQIQSNDDHLSKISERIELVLEHICLLLNSNIEGVNERFLFIAKFIAQNIYILKRQLKSTYDRLPWEEIEFCLVCFISSHSKRQETNLFFHAVLSKSKILNHLKHFAKQLKEEKANLFGKNIRKLANLPQLKRDDVVINIIKNCYLFTELYNDYKQIRDICSLEKISNSSKLALSADCKEREGQLVMTRVLQVVGEYLKNTLESPKLSATTSELILLSLQTDTRKIIIDLRNSISHTHSLCKRTEIEKITDSKFFTGIQNDIKKIGNIITNILYSSKMKMVRFLLKIVIDSRSFDEIKETIEVLNNVESDEINGVNPAEIIKLQNFLVNGRLNESQNTAEIFNDIESKEMNSGNLEMMEHKKLEKLIQELSDNISEKTGYEKDLFKKIDDIINLEKSKLGNIEGDYLLGINSLKALNSLIYCKNIDANIIRGIKFSANNTLKNISPKIKPSSLKEITELALKISSSVRFRMHSESHTVIDRLIIEIFYLAEFGMDNVKWIKELREKLKEKGSFLIQHKQTNTSSLQEEKYNDLLILKLSELSTILNDNALNSNQLIENFSSYKSNKKLQAVTEMLVLDIMSILGSSRKYLSDNFFFLDDNSPLLIGKCLRNHLAHDNNLVDVLFSHPSVAVLLNASKLTTENIGKKPIKIGKIVKDDPYKLKEIVIRMLGAMTNQERMFVALKEGNLKKVQSLIEKGADIYSRNINLWTALHFAAQGSNLEVVKFLLSQNLSVSAKDHNHQCPLHIAAAFGRTNIVQYFVKVNSDINAIDHAGKTPLHFAAENGHKDAVEVLLKNDADTIAKSFAGLSPLHLAIRNEHINVVKVLLGKDLDVDINEASGGFTSLHIAAEVGSLKLVNFLLENKADVNAISDRDYTALHASALNGHLEVVNILTLNGAIINARVKDGCTPLHYAVENGHEKIVDVLLRCGANANLFDKIYYSTPLHFAAKVGHLGIVKTLLKNNACANVATIESITPLHFAIENGHLEIILALLKHGVDINMKDKNISSPLHIAAESGHREIANLLIQNNVEVNARDIQGCTPLHIASQKGHKDIIDLLIRNNCIVNVQDKTGLTPLHGAARNGNCEVIDILIKNNAEVNARAYGGFTPLHAAAVHGCKKAITCLINNNAEVNARDTINRSVLHAAAALNGQEDVVDLLIKNNAEVNSADITGSSPLHAAIEAGYNDIVKVLITNGANVNAKDVKNNTPLFSAIKGNLKEIVEFLVASGANVDSDEDAPLKFAVLTGNRDIVEILLRNNARIDIKCTKNVTLLHLAAKGGHKEIVQAMITKGVDINTVTINNVTPLYFAAQDGHAEVVELLIKNGARVNVKSWEGLTPLHIASTMGQSDVVEILMNGGAEICVKDKKNRTALELAIAHSHQQVVKTLLQFKEIDVNIKGNDDFTALHIAAQVGNLEVLKYLIDNGANIHMKNALGSKPMHIAAREGKKDIVDYFLSKGLCINDLGSADMSLLHYTAIGGQLEVAKYLLDQGADVNVKDANGSTPLHSAASCGYKCVVEILLNNFAIYNSVDKFNRKPLEIAKNEEVINLLASIDKLYEAVKRDSSVEVESCILGGACVNAKNDDRGTLLHYAAWKGYDVIVNILLQNGANPNAGGNKGFTPLHYAAKFSHLKVVRALLSFGGIYNAISDSGKTPLDLAVDKNLISLLTFVNESFKCIKNGNSKVIKDLNNIKDVDSLKAVMNAHDRENKTLIVAAVSSNFSKIEQLKEVFQGDVSAKVSKALEQINLGNYVKALTILQSIYEKRKEILGANNPGTLDIQTYIAKALYKQGAYHKALGMLEEIYEKQKKILGMNDKDSLSTRSFVALVHHRLGRDNEAFDIYQEVYPRQKEILGPNHSETLGTRFHMALVLDKLGKYEDALNINQTIYKQYGETLGAYNPATISAQNNIAMVLCNQGNSDEALKIYKEVFEKKKVVLGINHADTLRTLHNIAGILYMGRKYRKALKAFQEVLSIQIKILGPNHPDTLNTQYNLGNLLFFQGKYLSALKTYREILAQQKAVFGANYPAVLDTLNKIEMINLRLKMDGGGASNFVQKDVEGLKIAASNGDLMTVTFLLKNGEDANEKDADGRSPLHFAVDNGHMDIVNYLLINGANATMITNKGNTPLHTAVSRGNKGIIEVLLHHVSQDKIIDFVNAKTISGGTTSLHVAAKNGYLDIVKSLLKYGAIYNIKNKEDKLPLDLGKEQNVIDLLKLVKESFMDAKIGNVQIISKLKAADADIFKAITNARNEQGSTILQVAITNKHKVIAGKLLEMLKK